MNKPRIRRVPKMPAIAKKADREQQLARARELSEKITKNTDAAGISHRELEERAYRAFLNVKRDRRSGRN